MKKLVALALALLMVFGAFAGIGTKETASADTKVELSFYDIMSTTERMNYFETVFAEYAEQTGYKFIYEGEPWSNSMNTVLTMMAAGNGPDAFLCMPNQTVFIENGWLMEIDDYVEENGDKFVSLITDYFWMKEKETYGHNYVFPDGLMGAGIYYRKDWVEEIGYEIPTGKDWNWSAFWDLAEALTDPEKNRYGFAFRGGSGADAWANNYLGCYTSNYKYDIETKKWRSEQFKAGMKAYTDSWLNGIAPADSLNWGWSEQIDGFASGLVGLFYNDSDAFPFFVERMEEGTWGVLQLPYSDDGLGFATSVNCTYSWAINANTEYQDACLGLYEYMYTPAKCEEYCLMMGLIPVRKDVASAEYFSAEGPLGAFVNQMNNTDACLAGQLIGVNMNEAAGYQYNLAAEMQMYLLGEITFDEFFASWEAWNQAAIDTYFAEGGEVTDIVRIADVMAASGASDISK